MAATLIRPPDDLHEEARLVGVVDGQPSFNATVITALEEYVASRKKKPTFKKELAAAKRRRKTRRGK